MRGGGILNGKCKLDASAILSLLLILVLLDYQAVCPEKNSMQLFKPPQHWQIVLILNILKSSIETVLY